MVQNDLNNSNLLINNLNLTYSNGVKALDSFSITINSGMFALLGPNGAGKSSLMKCITTLIVPNSGSINFRNINAITHPIELRKILGYLPQEFGVYPKESAENLLNYLAMLKGIKNKNNREKIINSVLGLTNLEDVRKKNVDGFSGGMKQRFGIAQLLLNDPQLIVVDEPTAGLDPAERQRFLNVLLEISFNKTVIFSTHLVDDIKDICNDLAIVNKGKLIAHQNPLTALESIKNSIWIKEINQTEIDFYKQSYQVLSSNFSGLNKLLIRVYSNKIPDESFSLSVPNLYDFYFLKINSINLEKI